MTGKEELFQKAMNQGHSAAWDDLWDQAAFFYRQALEQFPDNPKALTNLGLALLEQQKYEEALDCYQRVLVIAPDDPLPVEKVAQLSERLGRLNEATRASMQAADLYLKNHEVDKAIENLTRVTRYNPEHLTAHSRLAMVYERLGRKPEAVSEYLTVAALVQNAGDTTKAIQAVNYAAMIMPENNEVKRALSMVKANQLLPKPTRRREGAGPVLMAKVTKLEADKTRQQKERGLDPISETCQKALVSLADILFDQTDEAPEGQPPRRGLASITRGFSAPPSEESERNKIISHLSVAIDSQTQEQNGMAIAELQKAIEAGLIHPAAYFDLGFLLYQSGQFEPALTNCRLAVKNPELALASRLLMGGALKKLGRIKDASIEYLEALKIADATTVPPKQVDEMTQLYESIIDSQAHQGDKTTDDNLCTNIASLLDRPDWKSHLERSRSQLPSQPDEGTPIPLAEMMVQSHSSRVVESLATIRDLADKNMIRTATEEVFFALTYAPSYLPLHIQIGELLLKENHIQEAVQKFLLVAQVYSVRGESTQATQLLRRVIQLNPMDLSVRNRLIEALMAQGKVDEAIREDIDLADTYYRLTELEVARKTYMAALRLAQQSSLSRKWSTRILGRIADIDMQRMDWRQALRVFEQIRVLQPDDEKVRQNLIDINLRLGQENSSLIELDGYINFLEGKAQRGKSIQFLKDLINDRPNKIELHRRLADLYQKSGQVSQAIAEMDTMSELSLNAGNKAAAVNFILAIINMNPPNAGDYQKRLQNLQLPK